MTVQASSALQVTTFQIYTDVSPYNRDEVMFVHASSPPVGKLLLSGDSERGLDSPHASVGITVIG